MNFIKVTTSGQVTIPKPFRTKFATDYYVCELEDRGILFRPVDIGKTDKTKKTYTMKDLTNWSFKGKNSREKNIASTIDQIIYNL